MMIGPGRPLELTGRAPVYSPETGALRAEPLAACARSTVFPFDVVAGVAVGVVVIHVLSDRVPRRNNCHRFTSFLSARRYDHVTAGPVRRSSDFSRFGIAPRNENYAEPTDQEKQA